MNKLKYFIEIKLWNIMHFEQKIDHFELMQCTQHQPIDYLWDEFADWEIEDGIGNRMVSNECQHWHSFWLFV